MRLLFMAHKAVERLVAGAATVELEHLDQRDAPQLIKHIKNMLKPMNLDEQTRLRLASITIVCKSDGKATIIGAPK